MKKNIKRIISLVFSVITALSVASVFAGCGGNGDSGNNGGNGGNGGGSQKPPATEPKTTVTLSEADYVRFSGRVYDRGDDEFLIFNTASGFKFKTDSKNVNVTLESIVTGTEGSAYMGVYVDGKRVGLPDKTEDKDRLELKSGKHDYQIYKNGDGISHEIEILKLTEAQYSTVTAYSVSGDGKFYPLKATNKAKMVFFGDSITCGYGNIDDASFGGYRTSGQDGLKTYAYMTAKELGFDIDVFAASGWAINKASWHTTDMKIPQVFRQYSPTFNLFGELYLKKPDESVKIVVINLGTNDYTFFTGTPSELKSKKSTFSYQYREFITQVRKYYPNGKIVLCFGMMDWDGNMVTTMDTCIKEDVARYMSEKYLLLPTASLSEEMGANGHPSVKAQQKASETLVEYIRSRQNSATDGDEWTPDF